MLMDKVASFKCVKLPSLIAFISHKCVLMQGKVLEPSYSLSVHYINFHQLLKYVCMMLLTLDFGLL
jgi:hypothetical protein